MTESGQFLTLDQAVSHLSKIKAEIGKVIYGQERVIDLTLITLLAGGHGLLVGVPGLAKTLLVDTVSHVMGLTNNRIQCTPDLMPADIVGAEVLDQEDDGKRKFRFIKGPVFAQFLMADEINRASPRTQSALLQAMQERRVTVNGHTYELPAPFHVLATQNPLEQEGTYPLPEAQLDRFLMQIDVGYPDRDAEKKILLMTTGMEHPEPKKVIESSVLQALQRFVREMPVGQSVVEAVLTLVRRARPTDDAPKPVNDHVIWAPGPRASQALLLTAKAKALLEGRATPSVDDILDLADPVLKHRMSLNYKARSTGIDLTDVIGLLKTGL